MIYGIRRGRFYECDGVACAERVEDALEKLLEEGLDGRRGQSGEKSGDVVDEDLKKLVEGGMLKATTDFSFVKDVDFIAICVPTPLDEHQQPDISYVKNSTIEISKHMTKGTMVVLESTTYPGTTEELIKPILDFFFNLGILGNLFQRKAGNIFTAISVSVFIQARDQMQSPVLGMVAGRFLQ